MSKGGYMDKPVFPQNIGTKVPSNTQEGMEDPIGLQNERYGHLLGNYFKCVTFFLNEFTDPTILEQ